MMFQHAGNIPGANCNENSTCWSPTGHCVFTRDYQAKNYEVEKYTAEMDDCEFEEYKREYSCMDHSKRTFLFMMHCQSAGATNKNKIRECCTGTMCNDPDQFPALINTERHKKCNRKSATLISPTVIIVVVCLIAILAAVGYYYVGRKYSYFSLLIKIKTFFKSFFDQYSRDRQANIRGNHYYPLVPTYQNKSRTEKNSIGTIINFVIKLMKNSHQ